MAQKGQKRVKRGPLKALGYTQAKSTRGAPPPTQTASMGLIMTALLVLKLLKMKFWQSNRIRECRSDRIFPDVSPLWTGLAKLDHDNGMTPNSVPQYSLQPAFAFRQSTRQGRVYLEVCSPGIFLMPPISPNVVWHPSFEVRASHFNKKEIFLS